LAAREEAKLVDEAKVELMIANWSWRKRERERRGEVGEWREEEEERRQAKWGAN